MLAPASDSPCNYLSANQVEFVFVPEAGVAVLPLTLHTPMGQWQLMRIYGTDWGGEGHGGSPFSQTAKWHATPPNDHSDFIIKNK